MKLLTHLTNTVRAIGISDEIADDKHLSNLLNLICISSFIASFSLSLVYFLYIKDLIYALIFLYVASLFVFVSLVNYFFGFRQASYCYAILMPFWYSTMQLLLGGYFGQDIVAGGTVLMVYILLKEQSTLRNIFIAHNLIVFTLSTLYITFYGPLLGVQEYPFDELVSLFVCLGVILVVFLVYDSKLNNLITLLKNNNRQLAQQKEEIQSFNYIASHDLKSPIGNIINFSNLIKQNIQKGDNKNLDKYLTIIETNAFQMNNLIEDVLEISSIDYPVEPANLRPIDLNDILNNVKGSLQEQIEKKGAIIKSEELPKILLNRVEIIAVFQNIIQNSIQYNQSKNPVILIHTTYHPDNFQIHFQDNGIGIAEEYQEQIFKFFKRLHTYKEYPGTGLGLGLCKKIMRKYEGDIQVKSQLGVSSTFSLLFPNTLLDISQQPSTILAKKPPLHFYT